MAFPRKIKPEKEVPKGASEDSSRIMALGFDGQHIARALMGLTDITQVGILPTNHLEVVSRHLAGIGNSLIFAFSYGACVGDVETASIPPRPLRAETLG